MFFRVDVEDNLGLSVLRDLLLSFLARHALRLFYLQLLILARAIHAHAVIVDHDKQIVFALSGSLGCLGVG